MIALSDYLRKNLDDLFRLWLWRVTLLGAVSFLAFSVLDFVATP